LSDSLTPLPSTIPAGSIVDTYLRDSGGEGQDRSVARQLESIKAYCVRHGLKLRHVYKDAAKSGGSTSGRDEFDRMISSSRIEADRPAAILLWNYARFARNLDDATYYKALLRKRDIIVHSLTDHIPEGPYGRFVEILIDISDEEKRRQTSADTKDGLRSIVMQGAIPGVPPRGFKREPIFTINPRTGQQRKNHRWIPDPKFTNRIQKAFKMRAQGASLNDIQKATKLFSTINSYATLWTNKLFIGMLEYGDIVIQDYCEPIIEKSLWDKVQLIQQGFAQGKRMKEGNKNHPRRANSDFILSGLARCARCGSSLFGRTSHQKTGYKYQSYLCTLAYRKRGACSKGRIPRPAFEAAVINALTDDILKEENISKLMTLREQRDSVLTAETNQQRRDVLTQIAANKKQLKNIADAIAENGSSATLLARLNQLEHEQLEFTLTLNNLEENVRAGLAPALTSAQLKERLARIVEILKSKDPQAKKIVLRALISQVDVEREDNFLRGTIYYFMPDNDDIISENDGDLSPDDLPPPKGTDAVPTPRQSSGPLF
jgi:DNA invertase Pin-like site-specific DNA recombinase/DNA-binding FrmR family transcriptional regulator